jgi:class 3 adenylate cyclase
MESEKFYKKIRIFAASPGDVFKERDGLKSIVEGINQTGGIADQVGIFFEVLDWRTHVKPNMGRPEDVILDQLPVDKWDLFIGILWSRFGSPPGTNLDSGEEFESGTEEEFVLAYDSWQKRRIPQIHFYRCVRSLRPRSFDPVQYQKVDSFFKKFESKGKYPGFYISFNETTDFLNKVQQHLIQYLKHINIKQSKNKEKLIFDDYKPGKIMEVELKVGYTYRMAFLRVDICDHSKYKKKYQNDTLQKLYTNFYNFVYETARIYRGDEFHWAGDGGIIAFWGDDICNRAVLTGIKLLNNLSIFNLDKNQSPLKEPIQIRIAAHVGIVEWRIPKNQVFDESINYISHLEKEGTSPGTFSITDILYSEINNNLQKIFVYGKEFQNNPIYIYKGIILQPTQRVELDENYPKNVLKEIDEKSLCFLDDLRKGVTTIKRNINKDAMRRNLEEIYDIIESFYECFSKYDKRWSKEYFQDLDRCIELIINKEEYFYKEVERLCFEWDGKRTQNSDLLPISKFIGLLRTNIIPYLKDLSSQLRQHLTGEFFLEHASKKVPTQKIVKLIEANDFEEESNFVELFLSERDGLIDYILNQKNDPYYERLIARLWKLANFVLLEDLAFIRSNVSSKQSRLVFQSLISSYERGNYFKLVLTIIARKVFNPYKKFIVEEFEKNEMYPNEKDLIIVLKCFLIYPSFEEKIGDILKQIYFHDLWEIIAYFKTPLKVILEISKHIVYLKTNNVKDKNESLDPNDIMKIFFDLIQKRLIRDLENIRNQTPLIQILLMIITFYKFDFFVQTGYFERLEELRLSLISRTRDIPNIKSEVLDKLMKEIKDERDSKGKPRATIPRNLHKIPLPIQRRLAKEGHYILEFINSNNVQIAKETKRYINLNNIAIVLKSFKINQNLMNDLLDPIPLS